MNIKNKYCLLSELSQAEIYKLKRLMPDSANFDFCKSEVLIGFSPKGTAGTWDMAFFPEIITYKEMLVLLYANQEEEGTMESISGTNDPVNNPSHYTGHPSGIECIQITEHMGFNLGNALKYIWRCDLKLDAVEDLKKARWYIDRELAKRTK